MNKAMTVKRVVNPHALYHAVLDLLAEEVRSSAGEGGKGEARETRVDNSSSRRHLTTTSTSNSSSKLIIMIISSSSNSNLGIKLSPEAAAPKVR